MKKIFLVLSVLFVFALCSPVYAVSGDCPRASAEEGGCPFENVPPAGSQGWNYCPYCGRHLGQGGYGMGPGMMGRGYGYHMGPGYGMGTGMMGPGSYQQNEACQKYLDDTAEMRKELNTKRYEYFEAVRNPKTKPETVAELEKQLRELQEKVYSKAPQGCWAQ